MKYLIKLILLIFIVNAAWGQLVATPSLNINASIECNTEADDEYLDYMESTRELRESINLDNIRQNHTIYIAANVLIEEAGDWFSTEEVDQSINILNTYFEPVGLTFERCLPVNYINLIDFTGPTFMTEDGCTVELYETELLSGFINVFYSPDLSGGNATLPDGCLGRVKVGYEWVYGRTFAHEVGHYLNLLHTYQNSRSENPDAKENVPRSGPQANCGQSGVGDELCDTPADPTLMWYTKTIDGEEVPITYVTTRCANAADDIPPCEIFSLEDLQSSIDCNFGDMHGNTYQPPTDNIMGVAITDCPQIFTQGQIERMRISLLVDRYHLLTNNCEDCQISEDLPAGHLHDENTFEVHSVSEDIISRATVKGENLSPGSDPAFTIYNAGKSICLNRYFEAEYGSTFLAYIEGCDPPESLRAASIINSNTFLSNINVFPNPFSSNAELTFSLLKDSNLTISIFDLVGNQIGKLANGKQYEKGKHQIPINGTDLSTGIYYCTIQAGNQIETKKMVLTK